MRNEREKTEMYIFNANGINFVVDIETFDIFAISLNHIDKIVYSVVITENHFSIVNTVLNG